jgi:hypothetical protein
MAVSLLPLALTRPAEGGRARSVPGGARERHPGEGA